MYEFPTEFEREAFKAGERAARAAASWVCDGNSKPERIARLVKMLDDGDPEAYDYLPREPNLSGEFADDPTPRSLARDITGEDEPSDEMVDAIAEAWELGVSETFQTECERILRANL